MDGVYTYLGLKLDGGPTQVIAAAKAAPRLEPSLVYFILMLLPGASSSSATLIL